MQSTLSYQPLPYILEAFTMSFNMRLMVCCTTTEKYPRLSHFQHSLLPSCLVSDSVIICATSCSPISLIQSSTHIWLSMHPGIFDLFDETCTLQCILEFMWLRNLSVHASVSRNNASIFISSVVLLLQVTFYLYTCYNRGILSWYWPCILVHACR